jgi:ectoine hydroxylase-related dioxygenase (phytanoyl-CoA dioxygenase family)
MNASITGYGLTADQIEFFDSNGYLILRGLVQGRLLARLQSAGKRWIENGADAASDPMMKRDYVYAKRSWGEVLFRIDYLHDKEDSASLELLGSPKVLAIASSLCGRNFVPTYESMVFKQEGDGEAIRWHQDAVHPRRHRIFNFDLYLDRSAANGGALVVIPGSHTTVLDACELERLHGWTPPGAVVVEMEPGDVLLHDVMIVHGSPRAVGNALRRTIYYEFRAAEQISTEGPWDHDWIDRRMRLIPAGLEAFRKAFPEEPGYDWQPDPQFRPRKESALSLKVLHKTHTPGSYCSAGSVPLS